MTTTLQLICQEPHSEGGLACGVGAADSPRLRSMRERIEAGNKHHCQALSNNV